MCLCCLQGTPEKALETRCSAKGPTALSTESGLQVLADFKSEKILVYCQHITFK
jgi:hypothetical protein